MTIKEVNDRWMAIQEMRDEIQDRYSEGESITVLDELNGRYNSEINRFRQDLIGAGFHPLLAKAISETIEPDWYDLND